MPPLPQGLKTFLGWVVPHRAALIVRQRELRRRIDAMTKMVEANHDRVKRMERPIAPRYSQEDALDFLSSLGVDREQITSGSVPKSSLDFCCRAIQAHLDARPLCGLHVGNFVGISLCHVTDFIHHIDKNSTIVSIDPNLPHRGVSHPVEIVVRCLTRYGLQRNSLVLTGYSLEKSISNDGTPFFGYDPGSEFASECSAEDQLGQLLRLLPERFDFAFIDGNHDSTYLAREIDAISGLLKTNGLLILDDINWGALGSIFRSIDKEKFQTLGDDGRVGVLRWLGRSVN